MFPRRGALAGFLTVALLIFLLNYRTPTVTSSADFTGGGTPTDSPTPPAFSVAADSSRADTVAMASATAPGASAAGAVETTETTGRPTPAGTATHGATSTPPGTSPEPRTPTPATPPPTHASVAGSTPTPMPVAPTPAPTRAPAPQPTAPPPAPPAGYTGSVVTTKYGPMQVKVVWSGGKITDVVTLQMTNSSSHSTALSQHACPILRSEALAAQSANIATVSGATYTSNGYKQSMQSAVNQKP